VSGQKGTRQRTWTNREVDRLREMVSRGEPMAWIGMRLRRSKSSVGSMACRLGLVHPLPGGLSKVPMHIRQMMAAE
jgi:hypothetical protein